MSEEFNLYILSHCLNPRVLTTLHENIFIPFSQNVSSLTSHSLLLCDSFHTLLEALVCSIVILVFLFLSFCLFLSLRLLKLGIYLPLPWHRKDIKNQTRTPADSRAITEANMMSYQMLRKQEGSRIAGLAWHSGSCL